MPVASSLAHGQLSILVLAAYVWCYALWKDGRRFTGGMVLALAAFKIQLLAGFLIVLLLKRKWRELAGVSAGCLPLLVISEMIVGLPGLLKFPQFIAECEAARRVNVLKMANLRGLVTLVSGGGDHIWIVAVLSLAVLLLAALAWRDLDTGFSAGILASMLISYHFYPQDLSLLLIPLFIAAQRWAPATLALVAVTLVVLPLALALAKDGYFVLLTIPYMILLLAEAWPAVTSSYQRMFAKKSVSAIA
jgi:glycosyl transferase family 87